MRGSDALCASKRKRGEKQPFSAGRGGNCEMPDNQWRSGILGGTTSGVQPTYKWWEMPTAHPMSPTSSQVMELHRAIVYKPAHPAHSDAFRFYPTFCNRHCGGANSRTISKRVSSSTAKSARQPEEHACLAQPHEHLCRLSTCAA
eukprot:scaffold3017_cov27-Tisochrysis_lutea.AAC.4